MFRSKPLADVTVMQSIAFDSPNQRLFAGQLRAGTPANSGDLTLTQLTLAGDVVGHMYLKGFGHAVSIGAETVGRTTYLWTETDVDSANARGRQIARFRWQDGATLTKDSPGLRSWKPVADGAVFTPSVDQQHGRIAIRHTQAWTAPTWCTARPKESACTSIRSALPDCASASPPVSPATAGPTSSTATASCKKAYWATPYSRSPASPRPGTM